MLRRCSAKTGMLAILWVLAGTIVLLNSVLQYVNPIGGSAKLEQGGAIRHARASGLGARNHQENSASQQHTESNEEASSAGSWGKGMMAGLVCLSTVTAVTTMMPSSSAAYDNAPLAQRIRRGEDTSGDMNEAKLVGCGIAALAAASVSSAQAAGTPSPFSPLASSSAFSPGSQFGLSSSFGPNRSSSPKGPRGPSAYESKMYDRTASAPSPWSPNSQAAMPNMQGPGMQSMIPGMMQDDSSSRAFSPNIHGHGTFGKVYESPLASKDTYGTRAWTPTRSQPFGTVQKAYMGKVYELPATADEHELYAKGAWSPSASENRKHTIYKEYMGKMYELPADEQLRTDVLGLGSIQSGQNDALNVGRVYESKDTNGHWWPIKVELRNHDGSYTCSLHDEGSAQFGQNQYWTKVWAANCRDYDSPAVTSARQGVSFPQSGTGYTPIMQQSTVDSTGLAINATG